jgi:hypothetical protein
LRRNADSGRHRCIERYTLWFAGVFRSHFGTDAEFPMLISPTSRKGYRIAHRPIAQDVMLKLASLFIIILALGAADAAAHRTDRPRDLTGIPITSITHGEMAIIDRHRADVFALAQGVRSADPAFQTLLRYGQLQYEDCLWGLMPTAISDEASPFNECSHAYLAATKEVLLKMKAMPAVEKAAGEIVSRISYEAAQEGAAFIGCIYSGEGFNTADLVRPHWHDVPFHWPTLVTLAAAFGFLPATAFATSALLRRKDDHAAPSSA